MKRVLELEASKLIMHDLVMLWLLHHVSPKHKRHAQTVMKKLCLALTTEGKDAMLAAMETKVCEKDQKWLEGEDGFFEQKEFQILNN